MTQYEIQGRTYTQNCITPERLSKAFSMLGIKQYKDLFDEQRAAEIEAVFMDMLPHPEKLKELLAIAFTEDVSGIDVANLDIMVLKKVYVDFFSLLFQRYDPRVNT